MDPDEPVLKLETDEEPLLAKQIIELIKQWLRKAGYECQPGKREVYIEQGQCPLCNGNLVIRVGGSHVYRGNPRKGCTSLSLSCKMCKSYARLEAPFRGLRPRKEEITQILSANVSDETTRSEDERIRVITPDGGEFFIIS